MTSTPPAEFPRDFHLRMERLLGAEAGAFLAALADPAGGLRVNTLRLTADRFLQLRPFPVDQLPFPGEGFLLRGEGGAGRHPYHAAGLYYLQDPAAMVVGALVDPRPGEAVLDLAAAPGGKATHLAARMENTGLLVANDVNRRRARELAGNIERCGVRNAIVTSATAERLAERLGAFFDRVLVDAPCSGEAMFARSASARSGWSLAAVEGCARRQGDLLAGAADLVRPGGLLVYSTCTFSAEENEAVVLGFLRSHPGFEPAPLPAVPGEGAAEAGWVSDEGAERALAGAKRLWPHRTPGAGHFIAGFLRMDPAGSSGPGEWKERGSREGLRAVEASFRALGFDWSPPEERLAILGREVYELPASAPFLRGIPVVRPGLWLGTLAARRLEPAHALALAAGVGSAPALLDLEREDERVALYLSGHPIASEGPPGWIAIAVDGFPLGWGKRVGATIKNHYPKGLRWLPRRGSQRVEDESD